MPRILVADDDRINRELLTTGLTAYGFEVEASENGMEALALARQHPPDLIVSDILMPIMDGFSLCKHWKTDDRLKDIPFVFFTAAYTDEADKKFALGLGVEKFILKPQRLDYLVATLREVLGAGRTERARPAASPLGEEMEFFRHHNEVLFRKLENKMAELEKVNMALGQAVEEHKVIEVKLKTTNNRLARAQSIAHIGSWELDLWSRRLQWSDETYRILGYTPDEIIPDYEVFLAAVHPEDREQFDEAITSVLQGEKCLSADCRIVRKDGTVIPVHAQGELVPGQADVSVSLSGTLMDVTAQKEADAQIRSSLEEKELLLRELSHRTKNNMNVIVSLIDLQLLSIDEERMRQIFEDTKYRIMAMALVHEKLYRNPKLSRISMPLYLTDLTYAVLRGGHINTAHIDVRLDITDISMSIDAITPLGLVINELLSNSMKYAFPEGREGIISIGMRPLAEGEFELTYRDNGIGFANGYDLAKSTSLGLRLVKSLIEVQLKGSVHLETGNGVSYIITFREPRRKRRF